MGIWRGLIGTIVAVALILIGINLFPTVMMRLHPPPPQTDLPLNGFFKAEKQKRRIIPDVR